jgi:predicted O-methyltransferase YrrM
MTTCAEAMQRGITCAADIYDLNRHDVADWQLAWLWVLAQIAPDGTAVECGVRRGGSLACWAAARAGRGKIIAVDYKFRAGTKERVDAYGYGVQYLEMLSWDASAKIGGQVAFAFIDADHSEAGFPRDIAVWPGKMAPGGVLAFPDYDVWKPGVVVKEHADRWQATAKWEFMGTIGALIAFRRPA